MRYAKSLSSSSSSLPNVPRKSSCSRTYCHFEDEWVYILSSCNMCCNGLESAGMHCVPFQTFNINRSLMWRLITLLFCLTKMVTWLENYPWHWPFIGKLLSSTLLWCCLFFNFTLLVILENFINFGLGTVTSERDKWLFSWAKSLLSVVWSVSALSVWDVSPLQVTP